MSHRRTLALLTATCAAVAGCSKPEPGPSPSPSEQTSEAGFSNPVYEADFPDPQIIQTSDGFLAIATNGNGMNVQSLTSSDMVTWDQGSDLLPRLPGWSSAGKVWAPEVIAWPDGTWRLYYTTKGPDTQWQCLSVASSPTPEGPYTDESTEPLMCEVDEGGSIDGSPFIDSSGKAWLYWKNDGNAIGVDTWIRVAPLAADGLTVTGTPKNLIKQDLPWEGTLVEGPSLVEHEGKIHMFYSANNYGGAEYATGHAVADAPDGTFVKDPEPVLSTNDVAAGPGHNQTIKVGDQWWMVFHAWLPDHVGDGAYGRQMFLTRFRFDGDRVVVDPPAQTVPVMP